MDLVSLDEGKLNKYLVSAVKDGDVYGMWTSGKFCPGKNCTANSENLVTHWKWLSDWRSD